MGTVAVARKPRRCPNCGSHRIATYLYGLPHYTTQLKKALDDGSAVLGGCEIGASKPFWVCMECRTEFQKSRPK